MMTLTGRLAAAAALMLAMAGCNGDKQQADSGATTDTTATPIDGDACVTCHSKLEQVHLTVTLEDGTELLGPGDCVVCHGGDPEATAEDEAHVQPPEGWDGYYHGLAPDQLDALPAEYVRFRNPGDIRANEVSCGDAGCHATEVANQRNSVMTTNTGHYMPTRYYAGLQGQDAIYGSHPAVDPDCDPGIEGSVCELITLPPDGDDAIQAALDADDVDALEAIAYNHYLAKNCNTCHAAGYGKTDAKYAHRSTGCSSCHVLYNPDGNYTGEDEQIPRGFPGHAARHELTKAIPTQQCATCHFQGGRIGLNYQGIRESGFREDDASIQADCDPSVTVCKEPWAEAAYDHTVGYYILDEDTSNDYDETPPDVHAQAGMVCGDCHVGTDVHGDGRIYSTSKLQVDIDCVDCHGSTRERAEPGEDGVYRTAKGKALPQLSTSGEGQVIQTGLMEGASWTVPQPADYFDGGYASPDMQSAMGVDAHGWSHVDDLECDSCHNGYQLFCIGCHVTFDMRLTSKDQQTGEVSTGVAGGSRSSYDLDTLLLGTGIRGKAQPINPSQHVQMSIIDYDGELRLGEWVDEEQTSFLGEFRVNEVTDVQSGFSPFFQHTTIRGGRSCDTCHRQDSSDAELTRVKGVYGYGTGEFLIEHPGGVMDPLQFLDEDNNLTSAFVHRNTGPLDDESLTRALGVILDALEDGKKKAAHKEPSK